jgi:hypothetical protein
VFFLQPSTRINSTRQLLSLYFCAVLRQLPVCASRQCDVVLDRINLFLCAVYACRSIVCLRLSHSCWSLLTTTLVTGEEKTQVFSITIIIRAAENLGFDASLLRDEYCSISRGQSAFLHTVAVFGRVFCRRPMQAGRRARFNGAWREFFVVFDCLRFTYGS